MSHVSYMSYMSYMFWTSCVLCIHVPHKAKTDNALLKNVDRFLEKIKKAAMTKKSAPRVLYSRFRYIFSSV